MTDLSYYNAIIQNYYKEMSFDTFVRDIASRYPLQLYKINDLVSIYPDSDRKKQVMSPTDFEQAREKLLDKWLAYTSHKSFMEQFQELFVQTPVPSFHHFSWTENCDYANHVSNTKNGYLSFHATGECEDVYYSLSTKIWSKNIFNSIMSRIHSENIYQSIGVIQSYNIFYSKYIKDSNNLRFCTNCLGCDDCLLCNDLQNKKYHIRNEPLTKDDYFEQKAKILAQKNKFISAYAQLNRVAQNRSSINCSGNFITDSEDVQDGYFSHFVKHGKNIIFGWHEDGLVNAFSSFLVSGGRDYYGVCAIGWDTEDAYCSISLRKCSQIYYSYFLEWCSFCLWCVGLKNRQFCILNKQYSKEDWYATVWEIFIQMENDWVLGQFFSAKINPFCYNDSAAILFHELDKQTATKQWFLWRDDPIKAQISGNAISAHNGDFDESICDKIIKDIDGNMYTIQKWEYSFLQKHELPLPEKHRLSRIKMHIKQ